MVYDLVYDDSLRVGLEVHSFSEWALGTRPAPFCVVSVLCLELRGYVEIPVNS